MNITGQGTPAPARPPACLASLAHHPAHGHRHHHAQTRITSAQANPYFSAVLERAQRYFPGLGGMRLRRAWSGEIEVTPDALPVIDGGAGPSGLVIATGMSGHGFGLGPIVGTVVADIVAGAETGFDLRPFRFARFHDGSRPGPMHLI